MAIELVDEYIWIEESSRWNNNDPGDVKMHDGKASEAIGGRKTFWSVTALGASV